MIYGIRKGFSLETLVEFKSPKEFTEVAADDPSKTYRRVSRVFAHDWVKTGRLHETGLWNDQGRIRYAYPGV